MLHVDFSPRGVIDSQVIFHTVSEFIKILVGTSKEDKKHFSSTKEDEIKILLKNSIEVISNRDQNLEREVQPLKWVLAIKHLPNSDPPVRYCARLVSASNRTTLRHSVHGNSPTIGMHTIGILMKMFLTWFKIAAKDGKKLVFLTKNVA